LCIWIHLAKCFASAYSRVNRTRVVFASWRWSIEDRDSCEFFERKEWGDVILLLRRELLCPGTVQAPLLSDWDQCKRIWTDWFHMSIFMHNAWIFVLKIFWISSLTAEDWELILDNLPVSS
jgi:hypothetical protein